MNTERVFRRAVIFIGGQNLFRLAKEAFGHNHPNYDPMALARAVCLKEGQELSQVNGKELFKINRQTYASSIDHRDYRPKKQTRNNPLL